jgi:hypothetical protein
MNYLNGPLSQIPGALAHKYSVPADFSDEGDILWDPNGRQRTERDAALESGPRPATPLPAPTLLDVHVAPIPPLKLDPKGRLLVPPNPKLIEVGPDAIAHYVTFHQTAHPWGIRVSAGELIRWAIDTLCFVYATREAMVRAAFRLVVEHELFHFRVDRFAAALEGLYWVPVKWPYDDGERDPVLGYKRTEEALANASALRATRFLPKDLRARGLRNAVRAAMRRQGPGYSFPADCDVDGEDIALGLTREDLENAMFGAADQSHGINPSLTRPDAFLYEHPDDWKLVPITIQHDEAKYGFPPLDIGLEYFPSVQNIDEPEGFSKALKKLGGRAQKDWTKTKRLLAATTRAHGLDFKKWEPAGPDFFSVRVNDDVRAHLQWRDGKWLAHGIGHHDQMGH